MQDGVVEEAGFLYPELVVLRTQGIQQEVLGPQPSVEDFTRIRVDTFEAVFFFACSHRLAPFLVLHVKGARQGELDAVKAMRLACLNVFFQVTGIMQQQVYLHILEGQNFLERPHLTFISFIADVLTRPKYFPNICIQGKLPAGCAIRKHFANTFFRLQ